MNGLSSICLSLMVFMSAKMIIFEMVDRVKLDRRYDWVGPPDQVSKIRYIKLRRVDGETPEEAKYREEREALNEWNSKFWAEHNQLFDKKKSEFVEQKRKEISRLDSVSASDMSGFYKEFLEIRRVPLADYNREWYRRNLSLIWPAVRVNMHRFIRMLKR